MKQRILVLGSTGMAGHVISAYFLKKNYDVTTFSLNGNAAIKGDARDFDIIRKILSNGRYDVVINCIGLLNQTAENNKSDALTLNAYLPHFMSKVLKDTSTKIIHMSTDCVFSGKDGGYLENSIPDGDTFYDRTKAIGELINDKDLTFRCSIIGPDINLEGIGLFHWFMLQKNEIDGYTKAIWTGVTTITLAKAMEQAIIENITGLYHLVNNQMISKYELLCLFNKHFKDNSQCINKVNKYMPNKSLINTRQDFGFVVPSYEEMVIEMRDWILENNNDYPIYFQ